MAFITGLPENTGVLWYTVSSANTNCREANMKRFKCALVEFDPGSLPCLPSLQGTHPVLPVLNTGCVASCFLGTL